MIRMLENRSKIFEMLVIFYVRQVLYSHLRPHLQKSRQAMSDISDCQDWVNNHASSAAQNNEIKDVMTQLSNRVRLATFYILSPAHGNDR